MMQLEFFLMLVMAVVLALVVFVAGAAVALALGLVGWLFKRAWSAWLCWGVGALVGLLFGAAVVLSQQQSAEYAPWAYWFGGIAVACAVLALLLVGAIAGGVRGLWRLGKAASAPSASAGPATRPAP